MAEALGIEPGQLRHPVFKTGSSAIAAHRLQYMAEGGRIERP